MAVILVLAGWGSYELTGAVKARALHNRLLDADTALVPAIVAEMGPYRHWLNPLLFKSYDEAKAAADPRRLLHLSLALLPVDSGQTQYIVERLLDASPPEVSILRDALAPHKENLLPRLWDAAENSPHDQERQRLRAAAALATYDPSSPRWARVKEQVAGDLVAVNPLFLGKWVEAFRPVKAILLGPLAEIFRDYSPRRSAERALATNLLADYAADQPALLADLLLDASDRQFCILFPRLDKHREAAVALLEGELARKPPPPVFKTTGTLDKNDMLVKIFDVPEASSLPAKRFGVPLKKGKTYTITMDSTELDACLVLQSEAGKQLAFDIDSAGDLNARVDFTAARDENYQLYAASFKGLGTFTLLVFETDAGEKLIRRQANAAVALRAHGPRRRGLAAAEAQRRSRLRSYLIHQLGPMDVAVGVIFSRLLAEADVTSHRALLLSLGEFSPKDLAGTGLDPLRAKLSKTYRETDDPGLHAAAEWLLRHLNQEAWLAEQNRHWARTRFRAAAPTPAKGASPTWYVAAEGHTMVVIPHQSKPFLMGSPPTETGRNDERQHLKLIDRSFAIASKHVTMAQFLRFRKSDNHVLLKRYAPTEDCPVNGTTWYEAASYCNWLSKQEGIDPKQWCYETDASGDVIKMKANYLSLTGYRLPTEAEMEFACRAGTATSRYYGDTPVLLSKYGWYVQNANERTWPVGSLKPNDLGLFDMHGNVWCWCQEVKRDYPKPTTAGEVFKDREDVLTIDDKEARVLRGGSFSARTSEMRSAHRYADMPNYRLDLVGIRPARTMPAPRR